MNSDEPSNSELLEELKSIHGFLSDGKLDASNIPTLTVVAEPTGNNNIMEENNTPSPDTDLHCQSSLFDDEAPLESKHSEPSHHTEKPQEAKDNNENPFLPPHIRERLGKHRSLFEQESLNLALSAGLQDPYFAELLKGASENQALLEEQKTDNISNDADTLIDNVINEFLPLLRARLKEKLKAHQGAWKESK